MCKIAKDCQPIALMAEAMLKDKTASLTEVLDIVGYVARSDNDDALPPHPMTGVASIDATSARGPVTADR
eukprot:3940919-Rhodomonas_salina.6